MGCSCGNNKSSGLASSKAERTASQVDRAKREAAARASASPKPQQSSTTPSQTFTLQRVDGRTQTFGSLLEVRAAQARRGGRIV